MNECKAYKISRVLAIISILISICLVSACATTKDQIHCNSLINSHIIKIDNRELTLWMGTTNRVVVGQELDVFESILYYPPLSHKNGPLFTKKLAGKAKITEIIDEHHSKATILSGRAEKDFTVQLVTP
jgi:hypothetical protein